MTSHKFPKPFRCSSEYTSCMFMKAKGLKMSLWYRWWYILGILYRQPCNENDQPNTVSASVLVTQSPFIPFLVKVVVKTEMMSRKWLKICNQCLVDLLATILKRWLVVCLFLINISKYLMFYTHDYSFVAQFTFLLAWTLFHLYPLCAISTPDGAPVRMSSRRCGTWCCCGCFCIAFFQRRGRLPWLRRLARYRSSMTQEPPMWSLWGQAQLMQATSPAVHGKVLQQPADSGGFPRTLPIFFLLPKCRPSLYK